MKLSLLRLLNEDTRIKIVREKSSNQPQKSPTPNHPAPTTIPRPSTPGERPKRRHIGKPGIEPRPKAEGVSKDYGWDKKKGLISKNLPKVVGANKPKVKEGILDKIAQRYKTLK